MADFDEERAQGAIHDAADSAHEGLDNVSDVVQDKLSDVSSGAASRAGVATDSIHGAIDDARQSVSAGISSASATINQAADKASDAVKRNPGQALAVAVVIAAVGGFLVGALRKR
jgi:ElaB/YqjD/DUF883 family membrane-anchored ribosome-binding protein